MPRTYSRPTDIPDELFTEMARACGEPFATSYLTGALARNGVLVPWTQTGWMRLRDNSAAINTLKRMGLKLEKPEPFGSPNHPASLRMAAE